jgi:hypothetical protein
MAENEKLCALCNDEHDLQDSHLLPKHFYKYIDRMKKKGTKTQFKTDDNRLNNLGRQVTQYLLGKNCEGRFSTYGEDYCAKLITPRPNEMPIIYDHLKGLKDSSLYAKDVPGLESRKIYYLALSIIWRASQEGWPNYSSISLPEEDSLAIKDYLLSDGAPNFPAGYYLEVSVSPSTDIWTTTFPTRLKDGTLFFNYNHLEFHIKKDQFLFDLYSHPNQGAVPIIYKLNKKRSNNLMAGQMRAYKNAAASKKVVRLGQKSGNTED